MEYKMRAAYLAMEIVLLLGLFSVATMYLKTEKEKEKELEKC